MLKRIGLRGVVVGLVVALALCGTLAWAVIPSSVSGLISACYPNSGPSKGVLRVIDAQSGATCAAGESLIKWQQNGIRFQGAWSPSKQYFTNDLVTQNGGAFVAIKIVSVPGTPTSDTTSWAALASPPAAPSCTGYPHAGIDWSKPGSTPGNGCDLHGANLASANLSGANLTNANLSVADLSSADLNSANLSGANLNVANLFHATLVGANLNGATVQSAFGAAADLTGADFTNADLTGANFNSATGGDSAIWSNTTCPDGSNSDANGGTCVGFGV
jgi:hypothetical protein